jgi:hypothetical protein
MEGLEEYQWSDFNGVNPSYNSVIKPKEVTFWPSYECKIEKVRKTIFDAFLDKDQNYFSLLSNELELTISYKDNKITLVHKKNQYDNSEEFETEINLDNDYKPVGFYDKDFQSNNYLKYHSKVDDDYFSRPGVWAINDVFYRDWAPYEHKPLEIGKFTKFENLNDRNFKERLNSYSLNSWFYSCKNESEFIKDIYGILPSQEYGPFIYKSPKGIPFREDAKIIITRNIVSNTLKLQKFELKFSLETQLRELNCIFSKEYSMVEFILFEKFLYLCKTIRGINIISYYDQYSPLKKVYIKD